MTEREGKRASQRKSQRGRMITARGVSGMFDVVTEYRNSRVDNLKDQMDLDLTLMPLRSYHMVET